MPIAQPNKPPFITIEGGEGVGKSTLVPQLINWLHSQGIAALASREPGGTAIAQSIRQLFLAPPEGEALSPRSELYLVSAARAQHIDQKLRPALAAGQWVICDRFHDSTRVYQGIIGGLPAAIVEAIIADSIAGLEPDLTLLLDCPEAEAQERLRLRNQQETATRFDEAALSVQKQVREGFRALAKKYPNRFVVLNASLSPASLAEAAQAAIHHHFPEARL